jgi:hypothetical protein
MKRLRNSREPVERLFSRATALDGKLGAGAHRLAERAHGGHRVFAYFNNDPNAVATENAATLRTAIDALL